MNNTINVRQLLINEISLEGLDGITLQALWIRISEATNTKLPYPERLEAEYWNAVCKLPDFEFYELEKPRGDLIPFNRFVCSLEDADPPEDLSEELYPHKLINDTKKNILGSCATYTKRKNITKVARNTEYNEAKTKWGSKLVIVASQDLRNCALMGLETHKTELTPIQYCILERIGRSRYHGEITQGKRSLQVIGEDPKSLFYHRKTLLKHRFITKQFYHVKSRTENCSGSLLHLTRYYVERKSKYLLITEKAVEYLKTKPNYRAEYADVKIHLNLYDAARKIFKFADFQKFIHTDVKMPYRELYPNSLPIEWKQKNCDKEKTVRVLQLIDPDVDVAENWYSRHNDDEQGDDDEDELGFKNYENLCYGKSVLTQAAEIVREYGENGITQSELGNIMGLGKLNTRSICRSLLRRNVVTCVMNDVGRQRVTRFVSRRFESKGQMTRQFKQERDRMMSLLTSQKTEKPSSIKQDSNLTAENDENSVQSFNTETIPSTSADSQCSVDEPEQQSVDQPTKKIKLTDETIDNDVTNQRKRKLFTTDLNEPNKKMIKTEKIEMTKEILENIDKIVVKITVTEHDAKLKGYSHGFEDQLQSEIMNTNKIVKPSGGALTYRILRRANFIIECIRQYKVIADLQKLMKMIQEEEQDEGYLVKIDKKSLVRLLLKLAKDGHVKYMKATLTNDARTKTLAFVCEPSIDETHSLIQSEIEQAKMKFFIGYSKVLKEETGGERQDPVPVETMRRVKKHYVFDKRIAKELGFCPKFVRMRLTHELLFYLVYEQSRDDEPITTPEGKREWFDKLGIAVDDAIIQEMEPIYYKRALCWKTFIPPLPVHIGWPLGWTLICDILVRLPFRKFMQCCSATHIVEGIYEYVNHPIRKYYLVRDLPLGLRNDLLYKRKYIFQMHEIISRLCYCGLVQFGPQKFKEKDQVFVYINRKTSILNTTTSKQGYHEISSEVYERHEYTFENANDLEQYWYDLWHTCMNTRLGGRACVSGEYVLIEHLETKPAMIAAVAPVLPEVAQLRDNGTVPGNCRGAAGLDSALFAHLKRNWSWHTVSQVFEQAPKPPQNHKKKPVSDTIKVPDPKNHSEMMEIVVKKQMIAGNTKQLNKTKMKTNSTGVSKKVNLKSKTVIRKVQPKKMPKRKPIYDEIDKLALAKMDKLRTDWSLVEDHILLLCNIASQYLHPNRRKQMISFSVHRDILHRLSSTSISKTSRACQRRILYTMKNINTRRSVNMCLEEIRQNEQIKAKYRDIIARAQKEHIPELELNITFIDLVCQLTVIFSSMMKSGKRRSHILLPSTIQQFYEKFHICTTPKKLKHSYNEPKTTDDIDFNVVKTVVHSSMCCTKDKTSWAYQLFKIYQQYPENLLRSAITKTRQEQLISVKKSFGLKRKSTMPLSSSPYKLSIMYYNHLLTKIPYGTYQDSFEVLGSLTDFLNSLKLEDIDDSDGLELINPGCGVPVAIMELLEKVDIKFKFEIPDEIIVLDQNIKKDKTYERLVDRFYNILRDPSRVQKWEEQFATNDVEDDESFLKMDATEEAIRKNPDITLNVSRHVTTRIAFHIMRAEICEGLDDVSTQHLHDFFVVNACRVFINIPSVRKNEQIIDIEDFCEEYHEVKTKLTPELLATIKNNAIVPNECPKEEEIIKNIFDNNGNKFDVDMAKSLLQFINSCDVFGATLNELTPLLIVKYEGNLAALEILEILSNIKIVIKTGIEKVRYVHYNHKEHWIINSFKILRLEREKIRPITSPSKEELQEHMRKHKKNFSYLELQKSKLRLDLNSQQEIRVLISPWIRIDGSLNRRVLDRWLGTVLITLLEKPGITLYGVTQKFHYMKPVDIHSMISYLMKLKCVKQYTLQKTKTTLFSAVPSMNLVPATGLEDSKDIMIEPYYDAITKLSIFIGKKAYATDFLMNYYY